MPFSTHLRWTAPVVDIMAYLHSECQLRPELQKQQQPLQSVDICTHANLRKCYITWLAHSRRLGAIKVFKLLGGHQS